MSSENAEEPNHMTMVTKCDGVGKGMCVCPNANSASSACEIDGSTTPPIKM